MNQVAILEEMSLKLHCAPLLLEPSMQSVSLENSVIFLKIYGQSVFVHHHHLLNVAEEQNHSDKMAPVEIYGLQLSAPCR